MRDDQRTKPELVAEVRALRKRVAGLEAAVLVPAGPMKKEGECPAEEWCLAHNQAEQGKELGCLYGLARLIETPDISLIEILEGMAALLPPAWQYPHLACARVIWRGHVYQTDNFHEPPFLQSSKIHEYGSPVGMVEVGYLEEPPSGSQEPFLAEEAALLAAIAERLGRVIERMRAEEALCKSEERLVWAQEAASVGVWDWDIATGTLDWSRQLFVLFGLDPDAAEASFDTWHKVVHPDDVASATEGINRDVKSGGTHTSEYRVVLPDGKIRWINALGNTIYDEAHQPVRMAGICIDITGRKLTEMALRESEERFRLAAQSSSDFIYERDLKTGEAQFFGDFDACMGYASGVFPRTLAGWVEHIHPEDVPRVMEAVEEGFQSGKPYNMEYRLRRGDGTYAEWWDRGVLVRDAAGILVKNVGAARDITERKQAEERLRRSEERFRTLVEQSTDVIFLASAVSDSLYVTSSVTPMLGYTPDEFLVEDISDLVHPEDLPAFLESERQMRACPGMTIVSVFRLRHQNGSWRVLECAMRNLLDDPNVGAIVANFRDITEREQAEEALRESERGLQEAQKLAHVGSWSYDPATQKTQWSEEMFCIWGLDPGLGAPSYSDHLRLIHPDDCQRFDDAVRNAVEHGTPYQLDLRICRPDGDIRSIITICEPQRGADGSVVSLKGAIQDITGRKHLEEQLRQAQKMEAVGQLAGGIAHDFNNILQVILGNTEVVQKQQEPGTPGREAMDDVCEAAQRAAELTRQLLAFSRRQTIQPVGVDLNELVQGMLKMTRRVIGEHIELCFVSGARLATVFVDKGQIEQVLMNLCVNARDAMAQGGSLTIQTENVTLDAAYCRGHTWAREGAYVLVTVADTGCGMDADTVAHVFEPFFTTKGVGEGTGLGLAQVYGIVKHHEGFIGIQSAPGAGTVFKVYLPAVDLPSERADIPAKTAAAGGSETILVAEDDPAVLKLVAAMLRTGGYTVLTATNGIEALGVFEEHGNSVSLVLLDVMMPGLGGRQVMDQIQAKHAGMSFLFSSGYSEGAVHTDFVVHKGVRLIKKPYRIEELLREVRQVLDESAADGK